MKDREKNMQTSDDGLFIPRRQASMWAAVALIVASTLFLVGYFVGKKHAVEQFVAKIEQDSFADQIYASLCDLYDCDIQQGTDEERPEMQEDEDNDMAENDGVVLPADEPVTSDQPESVQETVLEELVAPVSAAYYAQLIGYHSKKYADNFVQKLTKKNIPVEVHTRTSVTAKGAKKSWYQVITKPYTDYEELQRVVARISREEKIKGAQIFTCS